MGWGDRRVNRVADGKGHIRDYLGKKCVGFYTHNAQRIKKLLA